MITKKESWKRKNCRENSSYDKALGLKPQQAVKETDMAGN